MKPSTYDPHAEFYVATDDSVEVSGVLLSVNVMADFLIAIYHSCHGYSVLITLCSVLSCMITR